MLLVYLPEAATRKPKWLDALPPHDTVGSVPSLLYAMRKFQDFPFNEKGLLLIPKGSDDVALIAESSRLLESFKIFLVYPQRAKEAIEAAKPLSLRFFVEEEAAETFIPPILWKLYNHAMGQSECSESFDHNRKDKSQQA